jgi:hypothetical protein
MADDRAALRREVLALVLLVVLIDAAFIAVYIGARLAWVGSGLKVGFTILWTVVTLLVVLRSLGRIRAARLRLRRSR